MKRAFTLIEALVLFAVIMVLAVFLWPLFARTRISDPRPVCKLNLKQIGLGFTIYTQDYADKFPPARITASTGWADALYPYTKKLDLFQCDNAINGPSETLTTDYFYNRRLSRITSNKIKRPEETFLCGDGNDNAPTWSSWASLPSDATTNSNSPLQRHLQGAMYCYIDGHVKYIRPEKLPPQRHWNPLSP